jgi:ABC-2 type transport system permease protein
VIVTLRSLADRRRGAMWWSIGTFSGVAAIVGLWPSVKGNGDIEDVVKDLPAGVRALFGAKEGISISSAPGYLQARLFSTILPVLLIVYAIGLGARAIGGAEEDGTLQLVVVAPVTRRRVAFERFAATKVLVVGQAIVALATIYLIGAAVGVFDDVRASRFLLATLGVTELALLHLCIAFTAGAVTGRRGPALSVASGVAVGGFVLHGLAASATAIEPIRWLSPWWWFLDRNMLVEDPTFLALGLPIILATVIFVGGVLAYERRDLKFP